jgi:hypothetical protein
VRRCWRGNHRAIPSPGSTGGEHFRLIVFCHPSRASFDMNVSFPQALGRIANATVLCGLRELTQGSLELVLATCSDALLSPAAEIRFTAAHALLCLLPRLEPRLRMSGLGDLLSAFSQCLLALLDALRDPNRYVIGYAFNCIGLLATTPAATPQPCHPDGLRVPNFAWANKVRASSLVCVWAFAKSACCARTLGFLGVEDTVDCPLVVAYLDTLLAGDGARNSDDRSIDIVLRVVCAARRCPYSNSENRWCEGSRQVKGDN